MERLDVHSQANQQEIVSEIHCTLFPNVRWRKCADRAEKGFEESQKLNVLNSWNIDGATCKVQYLSFMCPSTYCH
jgi:hypothetical protein